MNRNQEQEETTLNEKIRLNYLARKLEKLASPREITIASIRYQEQLEEAQANLDARYSAESVYLEKIGDLIDENHALKKKLSAIQAIINPDQTQE